MPNPRYTEMNIQPPGAGETITFVQWITPSFISAFIGMLIFISIFLVLTYFLYKRRHSKSEYFKMKKIK